MAVIGNSPATTGTTVTAQSFNGDASTVAFTLSRSVNSTVDLEVLVDNVQQSPYDSSYSVSGTTLTFSSAPATGTNNIYVIYRGATITTAQVIPDDGSVSTAKLQSNVALNNLVSGGTQFGRRNLIINGAMQVAQRGTTYSASTGSAYRTVDRFQIGCSGGGSVDIDQSSVAPDQFSNSLKLTVNTTDTMGTNGDELFIGQTFEAQNLQHLKYGASSAQTVTLSFWVRSSVAGDYGIWLFGVDGSRFYNTSYTINLADTWEYKTIQISGDASGLFNNDNNSGLILRWYIDGGPDYRGTVTNSWGASATPRLPSATPAWMNGSNTFYLTGVQLEVGTVATPFEHRSFGEELALCQRYYCTYVDGISNVMPSLAHYYGSSEIDLPFSFPVPMRANPSIDQTNITDSFGMANSGDKFNSWAGIQLHSPTGSSHVVATNIYINSNVSGTAGYAGIIRTYDAGTYFALDAEL